MKYGKWIAGSLGWLLSGGNILGAIAGYCIGSFLESISDNSSETNNKKSDDFHSTSYSNNPFEGERNSFLFSMLVLSSYVIRADGKIMHSEMEFVRKFLFNNFGSNAVEEGEGILLKLFRLQDEQGIKQFKETIRKSCIEITFHLGEGERLQLLSYLVMIAKADRKVTYDEKVVLYEIAQYIGLSTKDVDSLLNMSSCSVDSSGMTLTEAYSILGINSTATDNEVKAAYRKMALKYHPDRVAKLGDDIYKSAEKKFQKINNAKELIYKSRGL